MKMRVGLVVGNRSAFTNIAGTATLPSTATMNSAVSLRWCSVQTSQPA